MTTLKKTLFWIVSGFCILMMIVSIIYSYKPEWFTGIIAYLEELGLSESSIGAILATFGFGGTAGTLGFSVIKTTISNLVANTKKLSEETIDATTTKTNEIITKAEVEYNKLYDQYVSQNRTIQNMKLALNESKEAFNTLSSNMNKLINLEIINLNKTIDNPLTNEATAEKLRQNIKNLTEGKVVVSIGQEIINGLSQDNKVAMETIANDTTNVINTTNAIATTNANTPSTTSIADSTTYDGTSV